MSASARPPRALLDEDAREYRAGDGEPSARWPVPDLAILSPHRAAAPTLPLAAFGETWAAWIAAAAEAKGAPPDYVATALFSCAGAIIANRCKASPWEGWTETPIVWTGNVGLPSTNKSPALDAVLEPMRKLEEELDADFAERRREWLTAKMGAELTAEQWQADCKLARKDGLPLPQRPDGAELPDPPQPRRLLVNDATAEKLIRLSAGNERGLAYVRDELAGWIGSMDKYGGNGGDRALWLEAWGGRSYRLDRVKDGDKPIRTPALAVSLAGGIQPDRLASMILGGDDDGLAARMLFVWPEPRKPTRPKAGYNVVTALGYMRDLANLPAREEPLPFAPKAAEALQGWREDVAGMEGEAQGLFLSWLGKLPGYAVRLALVLDHLRWVAGEAGTPPKSVSTDALTAAVALLRDYFIPMARRCFGDAALPEAERDAVALARWLAARPVLLETVNARELRHQSALATREPERYAAALAELTDAGWLRPAFGREGERGGRQRKDWALNPRLHNLLQRDRS